MGAGLACLGTVYFCGGCNVAVAGVRWRWNLGWEKAAVRVGRVCAIRRYSAGG